MQSFTKFCSLQFEEDLKPNRRRFRADLAVLRKNSKTGQTVSGSMSLPRFRFVIAAYAGASVSLASIALLFSITALLLPSCANAFGQPETVVSPDGESGTLSFKPPDLSDEEGQSQHMPKQYHCDACKILAYLFTREFDKENRKRSSLKYFLPESVIVETADRVCNSGFDSYGVKEVKGVKHLAGPGTQHENTAGVLQGGGKWPPRLKQLCEGYLGEIGETELYEEYKEDHKSLEKYMCFGSGELGVCNADSSTTDKQKKKKKKNTEL